MAGIYDRNKYYINIKCEYCGKEKEIKRSSLNRTKHFYCCEKHYHLARMKDKIVICKNCNKEFTIKNKDSNHFCSIKCENEYAKTHKFVIKKCVNCDNEFKAFNKNKKFCSIECKKEYNKHKHTKIKKCKYCGKTFNTIYDGKFCSISCASKYYVPIIGFGSIIRPENVWNKNLKNCFDEETLLKLSDSITLSIIEGRKNKDNWSGAGYRNDIGHYVRSTWEANFARIILYEHKHYLYEKQRFLLSNNTYYIPDFYIIEENCFYEIKGYFLPDAKNKFELFKKEYPDIKIKLIYHDEYKQLYKKYNKLIPNWE